MNNSGNNLYEFEGFRFDAQNMTLWRDEEMISLPPKALDLLHLLLEAEGKLVTKQEILQTIWADTFVEDGVLTQNIYTLRQTLGKNKEGNQFIENIARRGYRFASPLKISSKPGEKVNPVLSGVTPIFPASSSEKNYESYSSVAKKNDLEKSATKESAFTSSLQQAGIGANPAIIYLIWVGIPVFIFSVLGIGFYYFLQIPKEIVETKSETAPIEQVRLQRLTDTGDVLYPTISPDGKLLAYVRHEQNEESVWIKQLSSENSVQILPPSSKGYQALTFSPDGSFLYFRENEKGGAIYQTPVLGGTRKKIAGNVWSEFSISRDGKQFAFIRRDVERKAHLLILANTDGSGERELSFKKSPEIYTGSIGWSSDGTKLAVAARLTTETNIKLLTINISNGQETAWKIQGWRAISNILWMPDDKNLIISARDINEPTSQIWIISYPDGEIRRLTNDLEAYFRLSLSADGKNLIARQQKIVLHLWVLSENNVDNANQVTFGNRNFDGYAGLAWTPDNKIIFTSPTGNTTNLYSINADGSNKIQLTENAGRDNISPIVSPDGRYIVFNSNRTGSAQIWRMDMDGRNQKQLTLSGDQKEQAQSPVFSPDGSEVFYIKSGIDPQSIWKVSIEGGTPVSVASLNDAETGGFLTISPDGMWLSYHQVAEKSNDDDKGTLRIGILPVNGAGEHKTFDLPIRRPIIQWFNNSSFDYFAGTFNSSELWRQTISGEKPQKLMGFPDRIYNFAWSKNGKQLVVASGKMQGDAILITNLP